MMNKKKLIFWEIIKNTLFLFGILLLISCSENLTELTEEEDETEITNEEDEEEEEDVTEVNFETPLWTTETHSNDVTPNFEEVFDDTAVKRLDIVISEDDWDSMIDDMTDTYGTFGRSSRDNSGLIESDNPIFVAAEVFYEDIEWYKVGVRFKGNSSLQSSWQSGVLKLSFKLDFDEFEDEYPEIDNQRFYGFKKLSLKNNFNDSSLIREKVAADIFRSADLAVSHTAFYTVYVDHGSGPTYFGLYTLTEEVDDTVIENQFTIGEGNCYKPDGDAATFASGTYDESEYEKKNNEDIADYSDVKELYDVINSSTRTSDPETWRANLDAIFDTDVFLKYLAINTTIQNWDTYGLMTHNYYLYNNPETNKLTWIPWDNNESLQTGKQGGSLALDFSDLNTTSWPIIGYMYNDDVYKAKYDLYLKEVINNYFIESDMQALYTKYSDLIEPYATTERTGYTFLSSSAAFYSEINTLKSHVTTRNTAVKNYLD